MRWLPLNPFLRRCLRNALFGLLLPLVLLIPMLACAQESTMSEVTVKLGVDGDQLGEGRVVLISKLSNNLAEVITFLPWGTPFESRVTARFLQVQQQKEAGELIDLAYKGIMIKRASPIDSDYVSLNAGQVYKNRVDITESYNFCADRHYILTYSGSLYDPTYNEIRLTEAVIEFKTEVGFAACE